MRCYHCGYDGAPKLRWKISNYVDPHGKTLMHLGAYCQNCRRWIKWVGHHSPEAAGAPPKPEMTSIKKPVSQDQGAKTNE